MFSIFTNTNHPCSKYQQQLVDTAAKLTNISMLTLSLSSRQYALCYRPGADVFYVISKIRDQIDKKYHRSEMTILYGAHCGFTQLALLR